MKSKKAPAGRSRSKVTKNKFVTRSGNVVKVHHTLSQKWANRRSARAQRRAVRLAGLPKNRFKRLLYHLKPSRVYHYWFSRDGLIMGLKLMGIGFAVGALVLVGLFAYFRKDLPDLKDISGKNIGGSVRYYDRTGDTLLWEDYDAVKRIPVKDEDISQFAKDATVAIEDKDFFKHGGFDVRGIMRAGFNNFFNKGGTTQGGSTITQQLVKLTQDWTRDRSYSRKLKELILSVEMERSYTKQEILTGYLNTAPYGGIEYGVEAAARDYFQKAAKDLTLEEASMLAAIPKSPRYYSPYSADFDREAFVGRHHYILDLMEEQGKITKEQRDAAKVVDVLATVKPRQSKFEGIKAPWFVLAAKKQLEDTKTAETFKRGGWKVITTLDMRLQGLAEEQVQKGLAQIQRQGGDNAGFAAEDVKTGQMVALVGGTDFSNPEFGQINYAQTNLPPGSSFKPYDYAALIEHSTNMGAGSVLYDTQGPLDGYPCTNKGAPPPKGTGNCLQNYDFRYPGPLTLRYALGGSRNVPAVKAMLTTGVDKTIKTADKLMDPLGGRNGSGYRCFYDETLSKEGPCYASSAIGDGAYLHLDEHVHGYATIARNGLNIPQTYILKIIDTANNDKVIDEWQPSKGDQAIRQDSAYIVSDILSDPNASYFPAGRKPHRFNNPQGTWKFGMKTGTTNDGKDGWMMGLSAQYAAGVWVGHHTRRVVMRGTMEGMTQPIWQGWMQAAHQDLKPEDIPRPGDLQTLPAYVIRSHVGIGSVEPSPATDLYPAWFKSDIKATGAPRTIDIISNKLATDCTPARAKKEITDADAASFSGDRFTGQAVNTNEKDDVHQCSDVRPSLDSLFMDDDGVVSTTVHQGTHPLSSDAYKGTVNFIANGQVLQSFEVSADGQTVSYDSSSQPGNTVISAEIIDSVLYDGQSPNSVVTDDGGATLELSVASNGGNSYSFTWNSVPGAVSYQICVDTSVTPDFVCTTGDSGDTRTVVGSNKRAYVKSNNAVQSDTENF